MDGTLKPVTDFTHIVGDVQYRLDALHIKAPRALCGISLIDPNAIGWLSLDGTPTFPTCPSPHGEQTCPVCAQIAGWGWCSLHGDYEPDDPCSDIPEEF